MVEKEKVLEERERTDETSENDWALRKSSTFGTASGKTKGSFSSGDANATTKSSTTES